LQSSISHVGEEFWAQIFQSPFGERLRQYACSLDEFGYNKPDFLQQVAFMDLSRTRTPPGLSNPYWGDASRVIEIMTETWNTVIWNISMGLVLPHISSGNHLPPGLFDKMWYQTDLLMWTSAMALDKPDEPGRVAKEFGLVDPRDPNRPTFTMQHLRSLQRRLEPATTPAPEPARTLNGEGTHLLTPSESVAKSGHAYITETKENLPKAKTKTRGTAAPEVEVTECGVSVADELDDDEEVPMALPTEYKLGRKQLKVCAFICLKANQIDSP
jgi:hypothetical protein